MKEIFDWLREHINEHVDCCKELEEQSIYDAEVLGYKSRESAYTIALSYINEAEAKWKEDCCEWKFFKDYDKCLCKCNENNYFLDEQVIKSFTFCQYCGKRIKVVE